MFRNIILFLFLTGSLIANDRPGQLWGDANRFYSQAEEKVRKGDHDEAVVLFKASLDMLKKIQYEFPAWNTSVVKNRVKGCGERLTAAEELILQSIKDFTKEELIERLKITQVAKAKFSKAMMILYEDLNRTKGELDITKKALNQARDAAGTRVADEAHLDKLTFENLKLRKKMRDLETQLLTFQESSTTSVSSEKVDAEVLKYKKLQGEAVKKEEALKEEKVALAAQLKELSFKYTELVNKRKDFNKKYQVVVKDLKKWEEQAKASKDAHFRFKTLAMELQDKLKLESERSKDVKLREAELVNALAALKKNGASKKMLANLTERNTELAKENTRLRKVEIDLSTKTRNLTNEYERNAQLLKEHLEDSAKTVSENKELQLRNKNLKESMQKLTKQMKSSGSEAKSLQNEIKSLKSQIVILQKVLADYKANSPAPKDDPQQVDGALLKAYEKKDRESRDKIIFLEKNLRKLQVQNKSLQEENITGDEEVIKMYVQARDELKESKSQVQALYKRLKSIEGGVDSELQKVMNLDDLGTNDNLQKLNELLFQANRQKDTAAAIALYTKALKLEPKNFDALLRLGMLFYEQGHFHDATIQLQKAFYVKPDDPTMLLALGISQIELGRLELAVSALSRLVGMFPEDAQAHLQLGAVLQGLSWHEAAIIHFEKSFKLDDKNGEAAFNLAVCFLALQEPDVVNARIYYQKAIELGVVKDPVLEKYFSAQ